MNSLIIANESLINHNAIKKVELVGGDDPYRAEYRKSGEKTEVSIRGFFPYNCELFVLIEEENGELHTVNAKKLKMKRIK